jgi:hypothetical protein
MNGRRLFRSCLALLAWLVTGCAAGQVWQSWEPDDQMRYFGLALTGADSAAARYARLPERTQRERWYQQYWAGIDSPAGYQEEHLLRLERAWNEFGGALFFRDHRSLALVNHGPPEKEEHNQPFMHSMAGGARLAGGTYIKARSWAIWEYPSQGRYYDFLLEGNTYQTVAVTFSDRLHPLAYFRPDSGEASGRPSPDRAAREEELSCGFARFRSGDSNLVRWEIYWQVPVPADSPPEGRSYRAVFLLSRNGIALGADTIHYRISSTGRPLVSPLAYGQRNLDLPPGSYQLELSLVEQESGLRLAGKLAAELVGYRPGVREVSDLEMATLQDSTFLLPEFQKGSFRRVIARLTPGVDRYQPFYVYYEAYHLATDRGREHQVLASFAIYRSGSSGVMQECLVDTRDRYYQDLGDCLRACHKIHPMGMEPGDYLLVIQVRDLLAGRLSTITHPFVIVGSAEDWNKPR